MSKRSAISSFNILSTFGTPNWICLDEFIPTSHSGALWWTAGLRIAFSREYTLSLGDSQSVLLKAKLFKGLQGFCGFRWSSDIWSLTSTGTPHADVTNWRVLILMHLNLRGKMFARLLKRHSSKPSPWFNAKVSFSKARSLSRAWCLFNFAICEAFTMWTKSSKLTCFQESSYL